MKRFGLFWSAGFLLVVYGTVMGQQFQISDYDGETLTIEYPPSFDGAYLFVESSSNLTSNVVWEAVDYTQVDLVLGDTVFYNPSATNTSSGSTNETAVPYEITPEYIEALANGEIENDSWTAGSVWDATTDGAKGFFRIFGLSFVDSDGDGVDNVSEYGAGTDPYTSDAPPVSLPSDDGDPQAVPGSVDSAPGDWNTPPQNLYQATGSLYEAINMRILAMDGTNGTFTVETPVATLGAWIEVQCGTWTATASGDLYPTVSGGRFYRTPKDGFSWAGKEHVFALALNPYDGSEAFVNHLVQASPSDPAGLALLSDGTPVLVDASNLWTEEKLSACLKHLITVECRLQQLSGGAFDPSDTTAMAQVQMEKTSRGTFYPLAPTDRLWSPVNYYKAVWEYDFGLYQWFEVGGSYWFARNEQFTFLDNLQAHGFGSTEHRGYVIIPPEEGWHQTSPDNLETYTYLTNMPSCIFPGTISKTFTSTDNETAWFMADSINYCDITYRQRGEPSNSWNYTLTHKRGFFPSFYTVLSTFDPPASSGQTLVMDMDRDGAIGTNDWNRVDESHPYRFWVNEDGNNAAYPEADLEDFFPAMFIGTGSNQIFKLSANVALDYIPTTMTVSNSMEYLHDIDLAQTLAGQIQSLIPGNQTTQTFNENDLILLAVSGVNTNAELYVHILGNGSEIGISTNYFSFSSITNMYRTKNLRTNGVSSLEEPLNWPDELTNDKDLVYVHGFNVDEDAARLWHKNIFKRLWHAGSNAKYHGVIWDGIGNGSIMTHFHNSVVNAFATAPWVADYIKTLASSETIVLGHSLGNMVVSSAICEHNAPATQYYAIDAAVALEAYGDVTTNAAFVPDVVFTWEKEGFLNYKRQGWLDYPHETWASEWYRLFPESDPRSKLTFRHKFADIQLETDVFNFYSSTEDILRVRDDVNNILQSVTDVDIEMFMHIIPTNMTISSQCAWQLQEMYKGMNNWAVKYGGGGSSKYTGWSFTEYDGVHQIDRKVKRPFSGPPPSYIYTKYSESAAAAAAALSTNSANDTVRTAYLENLKTDPFFNRTPWQLFGSGAATFAGGSVGDYEDILNYDNNEQYGAPDIDISNVKVSDWLLAKGFPSRTGPMGSASVRDIGGGWGGVSFDMHSLYMTDSARWYDDEDEYLGQPVWHHSDWRYAPYVHVYQLFEKIVTKEN